MFSFRLFFLFGTTQNVNQNQNNNKNSKKIAIYKTIVKIGGKRKIVTTSKKKKKIAK